MVRQRHLPRQGLLAAADQAHIGDGVMESPRNGRVVTRRRASLDVPAPGGPMSSRLWIERLHSIPFHSLL
jgi:hypothetical protein